MAGDGSQPAGAREPNLGDDVWYCEPAAKPDAPAVDRAAKIIAFDADRAVLKVFTPGGDYVRTARQFEREPGEPAKPYGWRFRESAGTL